MNNPEQTSHRQPLTVGQCATMACLLEVTAPKPGNVHRGADFENLTFHDFLTSAVAIAPATDAAAGGAPLGRCVLDAVRATRDLTPTNTNLGIVLLLAPLAAATSKSSLTEGVKEVLASLTTEDAKNVYEAIRLAEAGGLGQVQQMDVAAQPPQDLLAAMRDAAGRDLVARQYAGNFQEIFSLVVPWLAKGENAGLTLSMNLVHVHVKLMSQFPDSLIARKCGAKVAQQSADRAATVIESGRPDSEVYQLALADLDFWLRSDHHRRNPGTTADLVTAGLFVALRESIIEPPFR